MKTTILLDNSQITTYRNCPRQWFHSYQDSIRLVSPFGDTKLLNYGSLMHSFLEVYYTLRTLDPSRNYAEHSKAVLELVSKHETSICTKYSFVQEDFLFLKNRFLQYCLTYGANDFRPLLLKGRPSVELGFSKILYEDASHLFIIEGRIDLLAQMSSETFFVDHKLQGTAQTYHPYDSQFLTYAWATLPRGIINYVGAQKEFTAKTLRRDLIHFPEHVIKEWRDQTIEEVFFPIAREAASGGPNGSAALRSQNEFRKNRFACSGPFRTHPCPYTSLCDTESPEMVESMKKFKYVKVEPWTPWKN